MRRRNGDDLRRELERRVQAGDFSAVIPLARVYERMGDGFSPWVLPKELLLTDVTFEGSDRQLEEWLVVNGLVDPDTGEGASYRRIGNHDSWSVNVHGRHHPSDSVYGPPRADLSAKTKVKFAENIVLHLSPEDERWKEQVDRYLRTRPR